MPLQANGEIRTPTGFLEGHELRNMREQIDFIDFVVGFLVRSRPAKDFFLQTVHARRNRGRAAV
jgi:hypothetical protein